MSAKSNRAPYQPRTFRLVDASVQQRAIAALQHAPIDSVRPLEVVIREEQKRRKPDQSALMFAGPLKDISEQVWMNGKQYSIGCWHSYFKEQCLPAAFDPEMCLEGYRKYEESPSGQMVLVGSTTQLTVRGMSEYLEQLYAFGAAHGVEFSTKG